MTMLRHRLLMTRNRATMRAQTLRGDSCRTLLASLLRLLVQRRQRRLLGSARSAAAPASSLRRLAHSQVMQTTTMMTTKMKSTRKSRCRLVGRVGRHALPLVAVPPRNPSSSHRRGERASAPRQRRLRRRLLAAKGPQQPQARLLRRLRGEASAWRRLPLQRRTRMRLLLLRRHHLQQLVRLAVASAVAASEQDAMAQWGDASEHNGGNEGRMYKETEGSKRWQHKQELRGIA